MIPYLIRRLLWAVVTLIIISFVTFFIFYVLPPGDPAVLRVGHFPNPQLLVHIRHAFGVDRPFWVQYWYYVRAIILHFNFGYSYQYAQPVTTLIINHLPPTISLAAGALVIWVSISMTVGVISAVRQRSLLDRFTMIGRLRRSQPRRSGSA